MFIQLPVINIITSFIQSFISQLMKQKLQNKIEQLQKHYHYDKRHSISTKASTPNITQDQSLYKSLLLNQKDKILPQQIHPSKQEQIQIKNNSHHFSQVSLRRLNGIGKKYFDLNLYKSQFFSHQQQETKGTLLLPKLNPNFKTDLYPSKDRKFFFEEDDEVIKKRALIKVEEIYAYQKKTVDQKYYKISKIKNRLKLINRIASDKLKLKQKYIQLSSYGKD